MCVQQKKPSFLTRSKPIRGVLLPRLVVCAHPSRTLHENYQEETALVILHPSSTHTPHPWCCPRQHNRECGDRGAIGYESRRNNCLYTVGLPCTLVSTASVESMTLTAPVFAPHHKQTEGTRGLCQYVHPKAPNVALPTPILLTQLPTQD